jgi:hypothetical protein
MIDFTAGKYLGLMPVLNNENGVDSKSASQKKLSHYLAGTPLFIQKSKGIKEKIKTRPF